MEALFRLMWQAFVKWLEEQPSADDINKQQIIDKVEKCRQSVKERKDIVQSFEELVQEMKALTSLLDVFKAEAKKKSKLFCFWEEYIRMVLLMLQFIKAERTGNWELHLSSTAAMIPHFYAMDRHNYARWLPVYIADMNNLKDEHPAVYDEFVAGNHSVSRSQQPFAQVWSDMALEQSINLDSKSKGGIIGISRKEDALERWFLTSHERASITRSLKEMCGFDNCERVGTHKEARSSRVKRDEEDVQKLMSSFTTKLMADPFMLPGDDETLPLTNIATGVVLSEDIADRLLRATELGSSRMTEFVQARMNTDELNFWEPLSKLKIKTFSVSAKKISVQKDNRIVTLSEDRELFGRLLVVASTRDVDLREVLSYKLSSMPLSLAHPDGSLRKTSKSVLMSILEENVNVVQVLPIQDGCIASSRGIQEMMQLIVYR
ncbi:hypothetical protein QZH41_001776 [Actinostola sp. cb2023]|nr:hypothetical protein QZH41_001776 [Actinostola sp. cb2023]